MQLTPGRSTSRLVRRHRRRYRNRMVRERARLLRTRLRSGLSALLRERARPVRTASSEQVQTADIQSAECRAVAALRAVAGPAQRSAWSTCSTPIPQAPAQVNRPDWSEPKTLVKIVSCKNNRQVVEPDWTIAREFRCTLAADPGGSIFCCNLGNSTEERHMQVSKVTTAPQKLRQNTCRGRSGVGARQPGVDGSGRLVRY